MRPPVRSAGLPGDGAQASAWLRQGGLRARGERARPVRASKRRARPGARKGAADPGRGVPALALRPSPFVKAESVRPQLLRGATSLSRGRHGRDDLLGSACSEPTRDRLVLDGERLAGVRADSRRGSDRPYAARGSGSRPKGTTRIAEGRRLVGGDRRSGDLDGLGPRRDRGSDRSPGRGGPRKRSPAAPWPGRLSPPPAPTPEPPAEPGPTGRRPRRHSRFPRRRPTTGCPARRSRAARPRAARAARRRPP